MWRGGWSLKGWQYTIEHPEQNKVMKEVFKKNQVWDGHEGRAQSAATGKMVITW